MNDKCRQIRELLPGFVSGALPTDKTIAVSHHTQQCEECRRLLAELEADDKMLVGYAEAMEESYRRVQEQVGEALSPGRSFRRVVGRIGNAMARRPAAVAAAVVIAATVVIAGVFFTSRGPAKPQDVATTREVRGPAPGEVQTPGEIAAEEETDSGERADVQRIKAELAELRQMYAAGDVDGLIGVVEQGSVFAKVFAANYVGKLGEEEAIPALEEAAAEFGGASENNPFLLAIEEIRYRIAEQSADEEGEVGAGATGTAAGEQEPPLEAAGEFTARGVLSGLVTEAGTGVPIETASVEIFSKAGRAEAAADANGFYFFEDLPGDGAYRVRVYSETHTGLADWDEMPIISLSAGDQVVRHFELRRGCLVRAVVVNEAGEPVAGAEVVATRPGERHHGRLRGWNAETDEDGVAMLGAFEPADASYLIIAQYSGSADTKGAEQISAETPGGYAPAGQMVTLNKPGETAEVKLVLQRGQTVAGYAEYSDGEPAAGVSIMARPDWWRGFGFPQGAVVAEDGYFELPNILGGEYDIFARTSGPGRMVYPVMQAELPPAEGDILFVELPGESPGELVAISGRVELVGPGRPEYVRVDAYSNHIGVADGDVDAKGEFIIDALQAGAYDLVFSGPEVETKKVADVNAPAEGLVVQLEYLGSAQLQGVVIEAESGEPVKRFRARARSVDGGASGGFVPVWKWREYYGEDGAFEFEVGRGGRYEVEVDADGFAPVWSGPVEPDEPEPVVIALTPGGSITGQVIDSTGKAVSGAKVIALSKAAGLREDERDRFVSDESAVVTAEGRFVLEHLPAGTETIKVAHPDYSREIVGGIEVVEGGVTGPVEIVLTAGGVVEGRVFDGAGGSASNVTLYIKGRDDKQLARVVTDANGFYRVTGLPERLCYISRRPEWRPSGVFSQSVVPAEGETLRVDIGGAAVAAGRLVDRTGPLADVGMVCVDAQRDFRAFQCYARTDGQGRFSFRGLPDGDFLIFRRADDERTGWLDVTAITAGGRDIELGDIAPPAGRVLISVDVADANQPGDGLQVYMQEGMQPWSWKPGRVLEPDAPGEPYVVEGVLAGDYYAVVQRGSVRVLEPVSIGAGDRDISVTLAVPAGDGFVQGRVSGEPLGGLEVFSVDGSIRANPAVEPTGRYEIDGLPAGEYFVAGALTPERPAGRFTLGEQEEKVVDVDFRSLNDTLGRLTVLVTDENGMLVHGGDVWLEGGGSGVIEPLPAREPGEIFISEGGPYMLCAAVEGYKPARTAVTIEQGQLQAEGTPPVILRLEPAGP